MSRLICVFMLLLAVVGCHKHHGDDIDVEEIRLDRVGFDPVQSSPPYQIALFSLYQKRQWRDGWADWSRTDLTIKNITPYVISFNYVLSGPGWRHESAVVDLPPGATQSISGVSYYFYALDNFWLTIQDPVVYQPVSNG